MKPSSLESTDYNNLEFVKAVQDIMINRKIICGDPSRLKIAESAVVNNAVFNLMGGNITVEDWVFFGHGVTVLTGKHDYNLRDEARQETVHCYGQDVVIQQGAWIASNVTIVGPCVIGSHAVVTAGAVVTADVEPFSMVGGVPV